MHQNNSLINQLREPVINGSTRPEAWRRLQLKRLKTMIERHEKEFLESLNQDLGKPSTEALFEIIAIRLEIQVAEKNLNKWMRPRRIKVPISLKPGEAMVALEPLGCVLIIGPWNFPVSLILQPLVSSLAAGNTAILKPSEHAPATSALLAKVLPKYLSEKVVRVVQGDGEVAAKLLEHKFDHIFFTGGESIGRKVMYAAAKQLTPVTLELGGKSPAIVIKGADLTVTAQRLTWGKGLNAGQACVAPDYLLIENPLRDPLIKAIKKARENFYGTNPLNSPDLGKIVNEIHFRRLCDLLEGARREGQILVGGEVDFKERRIAPTLIAIDDSKDPLMSQEIFGPLLPVMSIQNLKNALEGLKQKPHPLAIYLFGGTPNEQQILLNSTNSGSVCFNDVIMQAGIPELPFGGVGASGIGRYHGLAGFETFSNQRSILKRPFWLDLKMRYPPYKLDLAFIKGLLG